MNKVYDLIAVGLGPFNLSLACLAEPIEKLDSLFLEQRDEFNSFTGCSAHLPNHIWHAGKIKRTKRIPQNQKILNFLGVGGVAHYRASIKKFVYKAFFKIIIIIRNPIIKVKSVIIIISMRNYYQGFWLLALNFTTSPAASRTPRPPEK